MACFDSAFLSARIAYYEAQITAVEAALTALIDTPVFQYTFDTGQTREVVTKYDIPRLEAMLDRLASRLQYWCKMKNGGGTFNAGAAF